MNQQDQNRALSLGLQQAVTSGHAEKAAALLAPGFKGYMSGHALARDEWLGMAKGMINAFPDGRHEWTKIEAVGDHVILCGFFTGTHRGDFQGMPATGKTVRFSLTVIDEIHDGKLVEHRGEFDSATLMQQLTQA
jgi:predicted ester cyclase